MYMFTQKRGYVTLNFLTSDCPQLHQWSSISSSLTRPPAALRPHQGPSSILGACCSHSYILLTVQSSMGYVSSVTPAVFTFAVPFPWYQTKAELNWKHKASFFFSPILLWCQVEQLVSWHTKPTPQTLHDITTAPQTLHDITPAPQIPLRSLVDSDVQKRVGVVAQVHLSSNQEISTEK